MRTIRASSFPRNVACQASAIEVYPVIETHHPLADLGSAVHELLAGHINPPEPNVADVAAKWDIEDVDDLDYLFAAGRKLWRNLSRFFPDPCTERTFRVQHPQLTVTGHTDVFSVVGTEARIADWKSGYVEDDYLEQVRAYSWLALATNPALQSAYALVVWLRTGIVEPHRWTRAELARWEEDTFPRLARPQEIYSPGKHCRYCPRGLACPAKTELLKQAAVAIDSASQLARAVAPSDPIERANNLALLLERCRAMEKVIDVTKEWIKTEVVSAGSRLALGNGLSLVVTTQERESVDYAAARDVLASRLTQEDLAHCLKVAKSELEKAIKANAGRGQKAAAWQELLEELKEQDALETTFVEKLEVVRDERTSD